MLVGGSGVFIHLAVLKLAISSGGPFALSQGLAAVSAMTSNFLLNNAITYADRRLRGWSLVRGMLSFFAICSVGLLGNVGVANALFSQQTSWWLSGLVGAVVGAVWNYSASAVYTWRAN
jgi:dolichol-phosphate mannosyltransferase